MQLSCPNCGVRYAVSEESWPRHPVEDGELALKPRKVRCSVCQEVWLGLPDVEAIALDRPLPPIRNDEETYAALPPEDDERPRRWPWIVAAALALILALGGIGFAAIASGRINPQDHGLRWPDQGAVAALAANLPALNLPKPGLPEIRIPMLRVPETAPPPLVLEGEGVKRNLADGGRAWEITATIHNPTQAPLPVPPIEIALVDGNGKAVDHFSTRLEIHTLEPGASHRFETTRMNPPAGAGDVRLSLKPTGLGRR